MIKDICECGRFGQKNQRKFLKENFPFLYEETMDIRDPFWCALATFIQNKKYPRRDGSYELSKNTAVFSPGWILTALLTLESELREGYSLGDYALPKNKIIKWLKSRYVVYITEPKNYD
jgi:hypothetical protein